jgi:hypothetical protein
MRPFTRPVNTQGDVCDWFRVAFAMITEGRMRGEAERQPRGVYCAHGIARPLGVFRMHNTVNGKSYVGTSVDLPLMFNRQRAQLGFGVQRRAEKVDDALSVPARPASHFRRDHNIPATRRRAFGV